MSAERFCDPGTATRDLQMELQGQIRPTKSMWHILMVTSAIFRKMLWVCVLLLQVHCCWLVCGYLQSIDSRQIVMAALHSWYHQ
jgi:hypothetical protein